MNRTITAAAFAVLLTAVPVMAQMMGGGTPGQHMTQQGQAVPQQQYNPYQMNPGMMGGYGGYGMGPQMMGGYGGYGYPMGPQMMGGYGGYGYPMGPQMMGGCGQQSYYKSSEEYVKFLDDTRDTRRKMHDLMFEYGEAARSPEPDRQKLEKMEKEMNELRTQLFNYKAK